MRRSGELILLEGPDGGGKTTLGQHFEELGYMYIHFGPMLKVKKSLARMYIDAMLPALLGLKNVVMDRSWLSEPIYSKVFRDGKERLKPADYRMLTRVAMRCRTKVVYCLPSEDQCLKTFRSRKGEEYLDREDQLKRVYQLYSDQNPNLPFARYNFQEDDVATTIYTMGGTTSHPLFTSSAGNIESRVLIVGESFTEHNEHDHLWQFPFVSFDNTGCSRWLADQLEKAHITERDLCWVNADEPNLRRFVDIWSHKKHHAHIICLGEVAHEKIESLVPEHPVYRVNHPQYAKRFKNKQSYELINLFEEVYK